MQELLGRITALDPEASETLRVVAYFDALVTSGVGLEGLLRASAALTGAGAGAEHRGRTIRFDANGHRVTDAVQAPRTAEKLSTTAHVWLERIGPAHVNDAMVVERLALAVEQLETRRGSDSSLDLLLEASTSLPERAAALSRLRIDAGAKVRVLATAVGDNAHGAASTVAPTRYGPLRATVDLAGRVPESGRVGIGPWVRADQAAESWDAAVLSYRLTDRAHRVVDATDLGAMLLLARAYDPDHPHPDVSALARLDDRSTEVLLALVECDSIRSVAGWLGMHHSTIQARHESLTHELGYDPRTPGGRMRYLAAALLLRVARPLA
jgi:hypothetical protein